MIWILAAIVVFAIYNAERLPDIMNKVKKDMPSIIESSKKATKELKEKAQTAVNEKKNKKKNEE